MPKGARTPKHQDDPRDEEDRDVTPIEPIEMGSPEERAYRDEITTRLNRLEEIIAGRPREHGRIGHNQPPEGLEAEEDDAARIKTLSDAVASIRAELEKPVPELSEVAQKNEVVEGVAARLRAAVTRKIDVATDEFAKKLGQSAGGLPFWYGVYHACGCCPPLAQQPPFLARPSLLIGTGEGGSILTATTAFALSAVTTAAIQVTPILRRVV